MNFCRIFYALTFCVIYATIARGNDLRCQCIMTESKKPPFNLVKNIEIIPEGPHCDKVQVILTLKSDQKICLNPNAPWVEVIIKHLLKKPKDSVQVGKA
ncbi:interleukin-8-like [Protopterus annectens]|uniref:interleukin-8-like n=1 Tax=Protopterus annectens TaxID=7888 RepID=UPI001CFC173B|nr:interleukin-8-like [Protopterus annectens]